MIDTRVVRMFENIIDASDNEVAKLCAVAIGATSCEARQLEVAEDIVAEARSYHSRGGRNNRPRDVKRAWDKVSLELNNDNPNKKVHPELSSLIREFFKTAVRAGYDTKVRLGNYLNVTPDLLHSVATYAPCIDAHDEVVRKNGRMERERKSNQACARFTTNG